MTLSGAPGAKKQRGRLKQELTKRKERTHEKAHFRNDKSLASLPDGSGSGRAGAGARGCEHSLRICGGQCDASGRRVSRREIGKELRGGTHSLRPAGRVSHSDDHRIASECAAIGFETGLQSLWKSLFSFAVLDGGKFPWPAAPEISERRGDFQNCKE